MIFFIKIPKSPLKFIRLKRSPKSGEKRMVFFGGENGISPFGVLLLSTEFYKTLASLCSLLLYYTKSSTRPINTSSDKMTRGSV